jgi:glucose-1-phosphate adenylyltransferase
MGIYVFSRDVLLDALRDPGIDFGREIIPASLGRRRVSAYLHRAYWADVGTIDAFYEANILLTQPGAAFNFYDPRRPIYTRARFLPPSRLNSCQINEAIVAEGCYLDRCEIEHSVVGIRTHANQGTRNRTRCRAGARHRRQECAHRRWRATRQ